MNLTLTLDEYLYDLHRQAPDAWHEFNEWIKAEKIVLCFEMTFEAGESAQLRLLCYDDPPVKVQGGLLSHIEYRTPATPPPASFMRWLLTREVQDG